jgi:hypothetical protein
MTSDITETPEKSQSDKIPISGRFDQYRSSYWSGAIAALGLRYLSRPFTRQHWTAENPSHFDKHKYSGIAGAIMYGVTGYYASQTWNDMKSIFAQPLAWEFNKDEKDVTFADFQNSKNTMITRTLNNYKKYNMRRFAVQTAFFLPFLGYPLLKNMSWFKNMHAETGSDLGVAANAAYLFSDIMSRKITPFEELQTLIDHKVNHSDSFAEKILATDLLDVYERHMLVGNSNKSFEPKRGTPEWEESMKLFERMADLFNQTYKNEEKHEVADFGFPKFIYLMGNGMIDPNHLDRSLACVEVANQNPKGVKAAEAMLSEVSKGVPLEEAVSHYVPQKQPENVIAEARPAHQNILDKKQPLASLAAREAERKDAREAAPQTLAV